MDKDVPNSYHGSLTLLKGKHYLLEVSFTMCLYLSFPTEFQMQNNIVHLEIGVTSLVEAVKFYKLAFPEWKINKAPFPDYYFVSNVENGNNLSMGIGLVSEVTDQGSIIFYVDVGDLPEAMQRITNAGGKILIEKTQVDGDNGYISRFEDPFGNRIGIWSET